MPDYKQHVTGEKSDGTREEQKPPRTNASCREEKQWKNQIELDQHGEVPPGRVEVYEIHLNIDEAQTQETKDDAVVHRFQARNKRREEINQMRNPVHWIEA